MWSRPSAASAGACCLSQACARAARDGAPACSAMRIDSEPSTSTATWLGRRVTFCSRTAGSKKSASAASTAPRRSDSKIQRRRGPLFEPERAPGQRDDRDRAEDRQHLPEAAPRRQRHEVPLVERRRGGDRLRHGERQRRRRHCDLPLAAAQDERHVHLVRLVVEAERVHGQVDAEAEGQLALRVAAGQHLVLPLPEVVARPGAAEIVLRVDDHQPPVVDDALQIGHGGDAADRRLQEVERTCR